MALVTIPTLIFPTYTVGPDRSGSSFATLTATGYKAAAIFMVPPAMSGLTITAVGFRTGTVSGTSPTVTVDIETVSSGNPTGTLYGGSAASGNISVASSTFYEGTLGTAATVAVGDTVAAVVTLSGGTSPSVPIVGMPVQDQGTNVATGFPFATAYTTSWAHNNTYIPVMWFKTSDGNYYFTGLFPAWTSSIAYKSNSATNKYALYFSLPGPVRIFGFWGSIAPSANFNVVLYDSDGVTVKLTKSVVAANMQSSSNGKIFMPFSGTTILNANTFYRLSVEPTTTSNITLSELTTYNAGTMGALGGGTNAYLSSYSGSWSQTTTTRPILGLLIDQIDNGAGGSGISRTRVQGGM